MLIAPCAFAISIAATPTLLLAAVISTKSPRVTFPRCANGPYAVKYCIQMEAPSQSERYFYVGKFGRRISRGRTERQGARHLPASCFSGIQGTPDKSAEFGRDGPDRFVLREFGRCAAGLHVHKESARDRQDQRRLHLRRIENLYIPGTNKRGFESLAGRSREALPCGVGCRRLGS